MCCAQAPCLSGTPILLDRLLCLVCCFGSRNFVIRDIVGPSLQVYGRVKPKACCCAICCSAAISFYGVAWNAGCVAAARLHAQHCIYNRQAGAWGAYPYGGCWQWLCSISNCYRTGGSAMAVDCAPTTLVAGQPLIVIVRHVEGVTSLHACTASAQ